MVKHVILSLDYELYGNGSGNVFRHVVEPTSAILDLLDKYGIKLTIFVEIVEFMRIKQEWEAGNKMGYDKDPIAAVEAQLKDAARRGHDIQLHIHPQWVSAEYVDGKWMVNNEQWRLSDYDGDMVELLSKSKENLEAIIDDVIPDYRCIALRAGGYNAQPSERIVQAMRQVGLRVDSSVVPGAKESGSLSRYDYTCVPTDNGAWFVDKRLEIPHDEGDIVELPITAFPILRIKKYLSLDRIKAIMQNRKSAVDAYKAKTSSGDETSGLGHGFINKIRYFFEHEVQTWDYCLFSRSLHDSFIKLVANQTDRNCVVLVGHPKSMTSISGLEYLLKRLENHRFCSISQYYNFMHHETISS